MHFIERVNLIARRFMAFLMFAAVAWPAAAQQASVPEIPTGQPLVDLIEGLDTKLGTAYINCDVETFVSMTAPDVELYHDEVGKFVGLDATRDILVQGICAGVKKGIQFRRELIPGSLVVYRMAKVGALEFRSTSFWQRRPGEPETQVGTLKEMTLWERRDGVWLVSRHIAYGHEPLNPK
jgi:hypothetical protein